MRESVCGNLSVWYVENRVRFLFISFGFLFGFSGGNFRFLVCFLEREIIGSVFEGSGRVGVGNRAGNFFLVFRKFGGYFLFRG